MSLFKEKILLVKIKKQDADAFAELYDLYVEKIYRFVYFKVSSVEEAQDITSEVFLKAWNYLQKEETLINNINSFLYQIARNLIIDFYRQRANHEMVSVDSPSASIHEIADPQQNVTSDISRQLASKQVETYLARLKDEYKEVVILRYLEGYSTKEIASIVGKKRGNIRVLLHRAIKVMSDMAEQSEQSPINSPSSQSTEKKVEDSDEQENLITTQ